MPLFIRDDQVDAMASELQRALNAPTKKAAVRQALANELKRARHATPLRERLSQSQAIAASIGARDPDFDQKRFSDEMWDGL